MAGDRDDSIFLYAKVTPVCSLVDEVDALFMNKQLLLLNGKSYWVSKPVTRRVSFEDENKTCDRT